MTVEEPRARVRARLEQMGADLNRVRIICDDDGTGIDLVRDFDLLGETVREVRARMVTIDTLHRCARLTTYRQSNQILQPLIRFARKHNVALVAANHNTKTGSSAAMRSLGSVGILGLARSHLFCGVDPHGETEFDFAVATAKGNGQGHRAPLPHDQASVRCHHGRVAGHRSRTRRGRDCRRHERHAAEN